MQPDPFACGHLTDRLQWIDRTGVGGPRIGDNGHRQDARAAVRGDVAAQILHVHAARGIGGNGAYRTPAETEHAGGALDGVMGLGGRVHTDRSIDPGGCHVAAELLEGELPCRAECQQVGRRTAAAVNAAQRPHAAQAGQPLQGHFFEQIECREGVALGRGDIGGGRCQRGGGRATGGDEGAESRTGYRRTVRNDLADQLLGDALDADADLRQRDIQLLVPTVARMQRVGMLEFQEFIQCRTHPGQQGLQLAGLGRVGLHRFFLSTTRRMSALAGRVPVTR